MARFDDLLSEARVGFASAPEPSLISALKRSTRLFCRETGVWQTAIDPFALVSGQVAYDWETPDNATVEQILSLKVNGRSNLRSMRERDMHGLDRTGQNGGVTSYAITGNGLQVSFWRTPGTVEAGHLVDAFVVLAPALAATELEDFLIDEWHDAIVRGMRTEMYGNVDMPWYDMQAQSVARLEFAEHMARAKRETYSGHHSPMKVNMRPFA